MSMFKKKKSLLRLRPGSSESSNPSSTLPTRRVASGPTLPSPPPQDTSFPVRIDDFGRPITTDRPAFAAQTTGSSGFGNGYGVGEDNEVQPAEMQLLYGYAPIATTVELGIIKVERIVQACAEQIRKRGLDTPLILSSMALDLSLDGVCSLIRSYLEDHETWLQDLELANPLSIGAFMKWSLARLVNDRGGRGFVSWELYNEFKKAERATGYQPRSCTLHLVSRLSASNGRLLSSLLSLFSSISAHSAKNGMSPRKLAALFSPYVFGLRDDGSFDETYEEWQRGTTALEHILLSFIRNQQAEGALPTFLERFITGYPDTLGLSYDNSRPQLPKGAPVEEVMRVKRVTRFHSRNLIQQAATWEVPYSNDWKLFLAPASSTSPDQPVYAPSYRHLLNIRDGLVDDEDDALEMQRFRSLVDKEWAQFGQKGFQDVDAKKLEFDLTEGEREAVKRKRDTLDWSTFETTGFSGRDIFAPTDLVFHQSIGQRVNTWPSSAQKLNERLRETEKHLPPFPYDTTPREEGRLVVEKVFFEAYADVLVGGGWARDELKESSFALIQWKAQPRAGEVAKGKVVGNDPRTEERWVLVEEFVPREYREALLADPKAKKQAKRVSFLRAVRRRSGGNSASPRASQPSAGHGNLGGLLSPPLSSSYTRKESTLRPIDENVFNPDNNAETKLMSLSNVHLNPRDTYASYGATTSYAPSSAYAPSVVSTVRAADGHTAGHSALDLHEEPTNSFRPPSPPPQAEAYPSRPQVAPVIPSNGAFLAPPVGFTKPPSDKRGFLARIGSRKMSGGSGMSGILGGSGKMGKFFGVGNGGADAVGVTLPAAIPSYGNGTLPGAPPLGPPVETLANSYDSPPVPPKVFAGARPHSPDFEPVEAPAGVAEEDPYDGIDSSADTRPSEDGRVLFRGSRSYPEGLDAEAEGRTSDAMEPHDGAQYATEAAGLHQQRPPRHESLPDSPKPDAEVPIDAHPSDRYASGVSQFSSRVANIVGLYEQRGGQPNGPGDIRLTQYGFDEASSPTTAAHYNP
ncbi:hypothetical protein RTG_00488 [Rhodotorula toruloides ATCC 204091]|uniref:Rho-GAP domain-containing protein n=1 Tax=Rhodotorula toruloides TaxID=5286 RepID=A0A0K3C6L9_RHOTO|nr:hypothetical protein RTG_00488 [Rhodotorula toruloides ATCC 204091]KAK4332229.1 Rho-GAP domain-containing protein [Rhodotorula toruloides]PRQ76864.1 protein of unknown function (DUF1708)-domain containing protein [Rhodotorula toruloides]